jgi:uncharacterized protein YegL
MRRFTATRDQSLDARDMVFDSDIENHAQCVPVVMIIDNSSSMAGAPIALLNDALAGMQEDLHHDVELSSKAKICVITFGHDGVTAWRGDRPAPPGMSPFVPASDFRAPRLDAGGVTPLVEAVELGIKLVAEEKAALRERNLSYYRPVFWCLSDGVPTTPTGQPSEEWRRLPPIIAREEKAKHFAFFSVSVGDISPFGDEVLRSLAPDSHLKLQGFEFATVLQLVSASAESATHDDPIDEIKRRVMKDFRQRPVNRFLP